MKGATETTFKMVILSLGIGLLLLFVGLYFLYQGYGHAGEYTDVSIIDNLLKIITGGGAE